MSDPLSFSPEEVEEARDWLRELGATEEDLDTRIEDLAGVSLGVMIRADATMSAVELAGRTNRTVDDIVALYGELGITVADTDEVRFREEEVELVNMLSWAVDEHFTPQEGHELIVVVARSLRSIADASVSGFVQTVEARLLAEGVSLVDWAKSIAVGAEMGTQLSANLGSLFNHYLRQAVDHQREAQAGVSSRAVMRVAIGFVDLVGFTPRASKLTPDELSVFVGEFESRAFDMANEVGVRIVKHIGDEIMFTAVDPAAVCRLALALRDEVDADEARPRGGVAHGEVITRHGDYYGPIVNLASRLTDEAIPGEILVPKAMEGELPGFAVQPAGRRELKGFDEPVEVLSLD